MSNSFLIATEIAPSGNGVDSSQDCILVDCVLVDFDSGWIVPGLIQFGDNVLRVLHLLQDYLIIGNKFNLIQFKLYISEGNISKTILT